MKQWKPIQINFPTIDYPLINDEQKRKMENDPITKNKYRFRAVQGENVKQKATEAGEPKEAKRSRGKTRK